MLGGRRSKGDSRTWCPSLSDMSQCSERSGLRPKTSHTVHDAGAHAEGPAPGGEPALGLLAIHPPSRSGQSVTPGVVFMNSAAAALGLP